MIRVDPDCLFCRIVSGEIPAEIVYEDKDILAFRDISPQAPVHILIIPKEHIPGLPQLGVDNDKIQGKIIRIAAELAEQLGVSQKGFRLVINSGSQAGQEVYHLHCHLLGGRSFAWPPG